MKKLGLACVALLVCGGLAGCGNTDSTQTQNRRSSSSKVADKVNKFGQSVILTKGNQKARMVVQSVTAVNPDNVLVTDVSHNYKDTHQYVVVTYKVTAVSGKVNLDAFDGSNLSVYDSKGENSVDSSNREDVTPKSLHKGEIQVMKIGVGLRNKSSKVTIHYGNKTWKGKVKGNNASTSSTNSSNSSSEVSESQAASQSSTSKAASQQSSSTNASNTGVNNAQDAVNAARAKYGDDNGNVHWNYMIDGNTGQPIKNEDGSYFVKGTANDGTMTGTQYSVNVHPDGSITEN